MFLIFWPIYINFIQNISLLPSAIKEAKNIKRMSVEVNLFGVEIEIKISTENGDFSEKICRLIVHDLNNVRFLLSVLRFEHYYSG